MKKIICACLILSCGSTQAFPVVWTLETDNPSPTEWISGSFTYDADLNEYSNISVTIFRRDAVGSAISAVLYDEVWARPGDIGPEQPKFASETNDDVYLMNILLWESTPLTNSGGEVFFDRSEKYNGLSYPPSSQRPMCSLKPQRNSVQVSIFPSELPRRNGLDISF